MIYTTNDAGSAAALIMHGGKLLKIEPRPDRSAYAVFTIEADEDQIFHIESDQLMVNPGLFLVKYRNLVAMAQRVVRKP